MLLKELLENFIITERYESIDVALEKYRYDDDIFISYSDIPKLGINPQTSFKTPAGIYTYPLKEMYEDVKYNTIPFAGDRRFVIVIKNTGGKILDADNYGEMDYFSDIEKLKNSVIPKLPIKLEYISDFIEDAKKSAKRDIPAAWIWNTTRLLSQEVEGETNQKQTSAWASILRKGLGYTGAVDRSGLGLIHPSEPTQAVFFSRENLKLVEILKNKKKYTLDRKERLRAISTDTKTIFKLDNPTKQEYLLALSIRGLGLLDEMIKQKMNIPRSVIVELLSKRAEHISELKYFPYLKFTTSEWQYIVSKNPSAFHAVVRQQIPVNQKVFITAVEKHENALGTIFKLGDIPSEKVMFTALKHHPEDAAANIFLYLNKIANPSNELVETIRKILNPENDQKLNDLIDKKLQKDNSNAA